MIIGIGVDLCVSERVGDAILRHGQRFLDRVFTSREQYLAGAAADPTAFYAGRFAAKEACVKALARGVTERVRWEDCEVLQSKAGELVLTLSGGALRRARRLAGKGRAIQLHVSIGGNRDVVTATVVISTIS